MIKRPWFIGDDYVFVPVCTLVLLSQLLPTSSGFWLSHDNFWITVKICLIFGKIYGHDKWIVWLDIGFDLDLDIEHSG